MLYVHFRGTLFTHCVDVAIIEFYVMSEEVMVSRINKLSLKDA